LPRTELVQTPGGTACAPSKLLFSDAKEHGDVATVGSFGGTFLDNCKRSERCRGMVDAANEEAIQHEKLDS